MTACASLAPEPTVIWLPSIDSWLVVAAASETTTPSKPDSRTSRLLPPPKILIASSLSWAATMIRFSDSSSTGWQKKRAGPPIPNQTNGPSGSSVRTRCCRSSGKLMRRLSWQESSFVATRARERIAIEFSAWTPLRIANCAQKSVGGEKIFTTDAVIYKFRAKVPLASSFRDSTCDKSTNGLFWLVPH